MTNHRCNKSGCTSTEVYERRSFGIYAGRWCDKHWRTSGYKDAPASDFDPDYAGETLEPDDWGDDGW